MIVLSLWLGCLATAQETDPSSASDWVARFEAAKVAHANEEQRTAAAADLTTLASEVGAPEDALERVAYFLCTEAKDFEHGGALAKALAEQHPDDPRAQIPHYTTLLLTGETAALEAEARAFDARVPNVPDVIFHIGMACSRQQRKLESVQAFERLVAAEPKNTLYLFALGDAQFRMRREAAAVKTLRSLLAVEPAHGAARCRLGEALGFLGEDEEAEAILRAAMNDGVRESVYVYAKFLFQRDRLKDAVFYFKNWTEQYPEQAHPWSYLSQCQRGLGRTKQAQRSLERFRELRRKVDSEEDLQLRELLRLRAEAQERERASDDES